MPAVRLVPRACSLRADLDTRRATANPSCGFEMPISSWALRWRDFPLQYQNFLLLVIQEGACARSSVTLCRFGAAVAGRFG
jgi:hypothetical protein